MIAPAPRPSGVSATHVALLKILRHIIEGYFKASVPICHKDMPLSNANSLCQAYKEATERAIAQCKASGRKAHVLDLGSGCGFLSTVASKSGAESVTACELHQPLADLTQRASPSTTNIIAHLHSEL